MKVLYLPPHLVPIYIPGISGNGNRDIPMFFPWMSTKIATSLTAAAVADGMIAKEVALSFKEWFKSGSNSLYCMINTLVIGYAAAGQPMFALHLFGKMRFQGLDLDSLAYHVLLNSLVEENCFDAVHVIVKQISLRGFENEVTHYLMLKSFCKQSLLDGAETFLHDLVGSGGAVNGRMLGFLVGALCKRGNFERFVNAFWKYHSLEKSKCTGLACLHGKFKHG